MFLEKLEIQGFKSFVQKTTLEFPQPRGSQKRGIAAIVGPNGSGKSNAADAIRWVMGEQSMKSLRGKKSEDVIFSGSEKLARVGLAEVSLILNNEDRRAPIDYSQIVITRRLYRSGESEYLLNKKKVRLQDITMLLAQANFGAKTYSIISQGMVDAFLSASPLERKEYFDEAAGTRPLQIKKEDAEHKLALTEENLRQGDALIAEITPRLKSLTRQVKRLERREEIATRLRELQTTYYGVQLAEIVGELTREDKELVELTKKRAGVEEELKKLEGQFEKMEKATPSGERYAALESEQRSLWEEKTELRERLVNIKGELSSLALQHQASGSDSIARSKLAPLYYEIDAAVSRLLELVATPNESAWQELHSLGQKLHREVTSLKKEIIHERKEEHGAVEKLEKELTALLEAEKVVDQKLTKVQEQMREFHAGEEEKNRAFFELERALQAKRQEVNAVLHSENERRVVVARLTTTRESVASIASEELGSLPEHEQHTMKYSEPEKEGMKREIDQLKNQLAQIGTIDPETEKEYQEAQERFDFLTTQAEDLRKGITDLRHVIADLDETIAKQFASSFQKISVNFEHFFKILFNGGYAKLVKTTIVVGSGRASASEDEEGEKNDDESAEKQVERIGIDIQATPPGKRLKNISMLSGGERALTSLALVCAIISNNPSPFVVLDEVDAALDEANATRFAEIIDTLSHHTQFIVVTHSRATMHHSNILYGVTMGDDGSSRILSLKFEDLVKKD